MVKRTARLLLAGGEQDRVLAAVNVIATRETQHQHLVETGDRLEVEAFELFDDGEAGLPDAALDQAALAVGSSPSPLTCPPL